MPLFLVTSVMDEGVAGSDFVVVDAPSKLAIAQQMLQQPERWKIFLQNAYPQDAEGRTNSGSLWEMILERQVTPEQLLSFIQRTYVDGDSGAQMRIHATTITPLASVQVGSGWIDHD